MRLLPRRRRDPEGTMTVVEHLGELRRRLVIAVASIGAASIVGFAFYRPILRFMLRPYQNALETLPADLRPEGALGAGKLIYSSPVDPFLTMIKIGLFTGLLLALPVVLWQVWGFVTPALRRRQRRIGAVFVLASVLLFAVGIVFAMLIVPQGLKFMMRFGGEQLIPLLTVDRYLAFLIFLILAFGISFEFPLLMIFLAGARVISTRQMRRVRTYAYMGIAVFSAIATPADPYSMVLMMIPLILFYEVAILVARAFGR